MVSRIRVPHEKSLINVRLSRQQQNTHYLFDDYAAESVAKKYDFVPLPRFLIIWRVFFVPWPLPMFLSIFGLRLVNSFKKLESLCLNSLGRERHNYIVSCEAGKTENSCIRDEIRNQID